MFLKNYVYRRKSVLFYFLRLSRNISFTTVDKTSLFMLLQHSAAQI